MHFEVSGERIEGVNNVREATFNHFENHFKFVMLIRPGMKFFSFKTLNLVGGSRHMSFTEDEVRRVIWNCDSYKTPGLDGINLGFVKDFWGGLKFDVMWLISYLPLIKLILFL